MAERNLEISSVICPAPVCFVNVQSSLHENVVFSVCACVGNAAYVISIMWNSTSGLDAWYHFRFNISWGLVVMGRSHKKNSGKNWRGGPIFEAVFQLIGARATPLPKNDC